MLDLKSVFLFSLLLTFGDQFLLKKNNEISKISCQIASQSLWKLYNWHFGNATVVHISLLLRKNPTIVEDYLSNIFSFLFGKNKFKRTFHISRYLLDSNNSSLNTESLEFDDEDVRFIHNNTATNLNVTDNYTYDRFHHLQKMRRYSGDPEDAYVFLTWDVEDFNIFLDQRHSEIVYNPRGMYIIIIISPQIDDREELYLKQILKLLWDKYGVLNVYVEIPCSQQYMHAYMFNPFVFDNGQWGILDKYSIEDALTDPARYRHNLRQLSGYPVSISMFIRRPTAIKNIPKSLKDNKSYKNLLKKSGGYGGLDGTVLAYIANYLNFTTVIVTPPPDREYGFKLNGTLVGSLGDVVYRKVAASFNARFISKYDSDEIEFTTPTNNDLLCLLVPKAEKIPQWLKIFRCFTLEAWLALFGLYIVVSLYWYLSRKIDLHGCNSIKDKHSFSDAYLEVFALFIAVPFTLVSTNNERIFIIICMFFNIVFVGTFQGSLYNSYTKVSFYPDINTLQELDESNLLIGTSSKSLVDAFGNDPKPVLQRLKTKILYINGTSALEKAALDKYTAAFERKMDARFRIRTEYTRCTDGFELLHVVSECPWSYHVSYIVPKGSPYLPIFNVLITTFRESGLISKWNTDMVEGLIMQEAVRPTEDIDSLKPFTLKDMQAAFYLIFIGLGASLLVFFGEVCYVGFRVFCRFVRNKK